MKQTCLIALLASLMACHNQEQKTIGTFERIDPAFDGIVATDASIEIIAEGYEWSEGPVWIGSKNMLLFSDVPKNTIYQWTEKEGAKVYLTPSGFSGSTSSSPEPGSNGLLLDDEENLILCQHGDRRLAMMNAAIDAPTADFTAIADNFQGKRFNSPNDATFYNYSFYFTDPPYGLAKQTEDPEKEIPFQGVYVAPAEGDVKLITDSLTRPNGIAFLRNKKTLIVANSDSGKARWYAFELAENDSVTSARIFYDVTANTKTEPGLPDGLKVDSNNTIFATGPGGVWVFNADGKLLGRIRIHDVPVSNCALSSDEKNLFLTADSYVIKVTLRR